MKKCGLARILAVGALILLIRFYVLALDPEKSLVQYLISAWTVTDGLPQNTINTIAQTKDGYLWFGTQDGLARFNGKSFKVFDRFNTPAFTSSYITVLFKAKSDTLWIGTRGGGLVRLDQGRFSRLEIPDLLSGHISISGLAEDSHGVLWIAADGNRLFQKREQTVTQVQFPEGLGLSDLHHLRCDEQDRLWIACRTGLFAYRQERFQRWGLREGLASENITFTCADRSGAVWIASEGGGLHQLAGGRMRRFTTAHGLPNNDINTLFSDASGNLWGGTRGGLCRIRNGQIDSMSTRDGLSNNTVASLFEDREGSLWLGTSLGVNRLRDGRVVTIGTAEGLPSDFIWSIYEERPSVLWIGTHGAGLVRREGRSQRVYTSRDGLPSDVVRCTLFDRRGRFWIGTNVGLCLWEKGKTTGIIKLQELVNIMVRAVFEDGSGRIWIGTTNGVMLYDEGRLHRYPLSGVPQPVTVYSFFEDATGQIWIATLHGAIRISRDRQLVLNKRNGFTDQNVYSFLQDRAGRMWFGTADGLALQTESGFHFFTKMDGLPNNLIYKVFEDGADNLVMSSNNGIIILSIGDLFDHIAGRRTKLQPELLGLQDGMKTPECNGGTQTAGCLGRDGKFYFPTVRGIVVVNPGKPYENRIVPPIMIEEVVADGRVLEAGRSELAAGTQRIEFHFAALSYLVPDKVKYRYRLSGLDADWIDSGNRHEAYYTNIPPGEYRFQVIACNNDGLWNTVGASFSFYLRPLFYQTTFFYAMCGFFIVLLGIYIYQLRVGQLKRRKEELEQLVYDRTQQLEESNTLLYEANKELEKLSLVASKTDNGVIIMDTDGNIEWINDGFTRMYQYSLEQLTCEKGRNIKDASNNPQIQEYFDDCLMQKKSIVYETCCLSREGGNIWSQTTLTPILDEEGQLKRLIAIDTEITKIKEAEMAADRANQSKSEFLARMSHEIRTPMNGVIGFCDMLLDTDLNEEQRDYARTISRNGEALITLLNDILDFSKIEAGELTLDPIDFDPELTLFDICDFIMPRIANKPVEIFCRIGDNVPAFIKADPGRFRQVIINLMGNAAKFTEQGSIELSLELAKEESDRLELLIKIKDTGIGIPENKLEKVFEVFQQADGSTTRKYGGTGLGLSICRQIAYLMEGNVWVESQVGKGSIFYFSCWVGKSIKEAEKYSSALDGKRVLVVDDNPTNLEILSHVLLLHKMEVIALSDSRRVIQYLRQYHANGRPFDICVMDIQMPGFSGYDLAKEIRGLEAPIKDLPLLAFSSSTFSLSKRFREAGFNGFLPKPIRRVKLIKMMERLLGMVSGDEGEAKPEEIITQHTLVEEGKHSVHILLVEDNAINLKLAMFMLEKAGYKLTVAENGQQAIEIFTANPDTFDLILMDIQMPVMDGKTTTRKLRKMGYAGIPIVAMTAEAMKGDREKCLEAGMNDYIPKPIKRDMIYKIIKKWCLEREK